MQFPYGSMPLGRGSLRRSVRGRRSSGHGERAR
jgi:hypothetical protein